MNILIFSEAAWDDRNSFGNTVSNFFCGKVWERDHFCNFYVRKQAPENKADVAYYNLSATDILKGVLRLHIEGRRFTTGTMRTEDMKLQVAHEKEQKRIDRLHKNGNQLVYYGHELVWRSRIWLNRAFKQFVAENQPDVLFAFAASPYILLPLIQYLKKHTQCKVILLVADDVFGNYDRCAFFRKGYLKSELQKCISMADRIFGISDEMSELYRERFGKAVTTLYKGCDLSEQPKQYLNRPLRFIYAGNLYYGRDNTLALVASALEQVNRDGVKAVLEIYTGTTVTEELRKKLNKAGTSEIMGSRPYVEIRKILHDADVVLHVESFERESTETVRYSFSTKIIDCLQSGNQVLGIGPKGLASIEYLRKIPGVLVADEPYKISSCIQEFTSEGSKISENSAAIRTFALEKHDICTVQKRLRSDFENVAG